MLVCLLVLAAGLITVGVALMSVSAAFIVAGVLVAAIGAFALVELP